MRTKTLSIGIIIAAASGAIAIGCKGGAEKGAPGALPANGNPSSMPRLAASTYFAHGHLLERQGDFRGAIEQYQRALEVSPNFPSARNRMGITLNKMRRHEEATQQFHIALNSKPNDAQLLNNFGFSLFLCGDYIGAENAFRRALQVAPSFTRAHMNLGLVLGKLNRLDEAFAEFQAACSEADAYYNISVLQVDAGLYAEAAVSLERTIALNPKLEIAREQLREVARLAAIHDARREAAQTAHAAAQATLVTEETAIAAAAPIAETPAGIADESPQVEIEESPQVGMEEAPQGGESAPIGDIATETTEPAETHAAPETGIETPADETPIAETATIGMSDESVESETTIAADATTETETPIAIEPEIAPTGIDPAVSMEDASAAPADEALETTIEGPDDVRLDETTGTNMPESDPCTEAPAVDQAQLREILSAELEALIAAGYAPLNDSGAGESELAAFVSARVATVGGAHFTPEAVAQQPEIAFVGSTLMFPANGGTMNPELDDEAVCFAQNPKRGVLELCRMALDASVAGYGALRENVLVELEQRITTDPLFDEETLMEE